MKVLILSQKPNSRSTQRLLEAGRALDHDVQVVDYLQCHMNIAAHRPQVIHRGESVGNVGAVIPRVSAANTFYGNAVVRQFEMMGVYTPNPSQAIARARDKLRSLQILSRKGVGLPVTAFAHSAEDVDGLIKAVGGTPLVIKLLEGTQGIGVVLAETHGAARSVIEAFRGLNANILVQEFIREAEGCDIRCFVVGDKVVGAMMRRAPAGEFRSNIHRGGKGEPVKLTPEERSTAVRAAKAMGLKIAGVDMIRSNHGPVVIEVNSSPGLEGIEGATGKDIASVIIQYVVKQAEVGRNEDRVRH